MNIFLFWRISSVRQGLIPSVISLSCIFCLMSGQRRWYIPRSPRMFSETFKIRRFLL